MVALNCSSDAIVPMWAYMLVTSYLNQVGLKFISEERRGIQKIFTDNINSIDASEFENKKVIVKGCGQIPLTESYILQLPKNYKIQ